MLLMCQGKGAPEATKLSLWQRWGPREEDLSLKDPHTGRPWQETGAVPHDFEEDAVVTFEDLGALPILTGTFETPGYLETD